MVKEIDPDVKEVVERGREAIHARRFMSDVLENVVDKLMEDFPDKLDVLRQVLQGQQSRVSMIHHRRDREG